MASCDLCNADIGSQARRVSPLEFRVAVMNGLRPRGVAASIGVALGVDNSGWVQMALQSPTDWALCSGCSAAFDEHRYPHKKSLAGPAPAAARGQFPGIRPSPAAAKDLVPKHPLPSAIDSHQGAVSASSLSGGVRVRATPGAVKTKDKTVAVLLAVFLGFWTWCYTYKKDAWKFWLNLGLTVVSIGFWGPVAWIWAIVDAARRPTEFYDNFNQPLPGQTSSSPLPAMPPTAAKEARRQVEFGANGGVLSAEVLQGERAPKQKGQNRAIRRKAGVVKGKGVLVVACIIAAIVVVLAILAVIGSTESVQWDYAHQKDTISSYQEYIRNKPTGPHVSEARRRIAALAPNSPEEKDEWDKLASAGMIQEYLARYPDGVHIKHLIDSCKTVGGSPSIAIKGKALVWDMNSHAVSRAQRRLPSHLRASPSDGEITVFIVIGERQEQVGTYSVSNEPAYRQYVDIAVARWPEKTAVGMSSVVSKEPRASRPVRNQPEYGDPIEAIANWIAAIPQAK